MATHRNDLSTLFNKLFNQGDRRLKRITISIKGSLNPEQEFQGYALVREISGAKLSFFCSHKFSIDEKLILKFKYQEKDVECKVVLTHLHEQISSGRIMTSIPVEGQPFPALTFYRCFSTVLEAKGLSDTDATPAPDNVVPITESAGESAKASEDPQPTPQAA